MTAPFETYPVTLTPLSPIHIGSGEDIDWTRAVLHGDRLVLFDPLRVELPERAVKELEKTQARPSGDASKAILDLQRLFKAYARELSNAACGELRLVGGLSKHLNTKVGAQNAGNVINEIRLARCAINPVDGRPIIPGSSVKGALRTAEVARLDAEKNGGSSKGPRPPERRDGKDVYRDPFDGLWRTFQDSPFARIHLSDLTATTVDVITLGTKVTNERRTPKQQQHQGKGVAVNVELVPPFLPGAFRGDIRIMGKRGKGDSREAPSLTELMLTVHHFHLALFQFFAEELARTDRKLPQCWSEDIRDLFAGSLYEPCRSGRVALVRLGKFCSAESKTVSWRSVRIPQARNSNPNRVLNPHTLWLADLGPHKLPLGWAIIELADEPSQHVRDFCAKFGPTPTSSVSAGSAALMPAQPQASGSAPSPTAPRIVPDRSTPARVNLWLLENDYDTGRMNDAMLERLIKDSARQQWTDEDRLLLARLVRDKARNRNTLPRFKWKQLEPLLLKLPDA